MLDVVNYFIGAFHRLFFYVNNDWSNDPNLCLAFVIIVSCFCAITLCGLFAILKVSISALANSIRKE